MNWIEVRKALEDDDKKKVAALRQKCLEESEQLTRRTYLKGGSIQGLYAATYASVLMKLDANWDDLVAHFQHQVVVDLSYRHGVSTYDTPKKIQLGDSVAITYSYKEYGKTQQTAAAYHVIAKQDDGWLVSLVSFENDAKKFKRQQEVIKITKKNFIVGVRQAVPPIMKKKQKFYFLNFE